MENEDISTTFSKNGTFKKLFISNLLLMLMCSLLALFTPGYTPIYLFIIILPTILVIEVLVIVVLSIVKKSLNFL